MGVCVDSLQHHLFVLWLCSSSRTLRAPWSATPAEPGQALSAGGTTQRYFMEKWLMSSASQCKWELVSSIADQSSSHQNQVSTVHPSALSIQPRLQWGRDPGWVMGESNWSQPKRHPLLQAPSFSSHTGGAGGNTTVTINCNWRDK